MTLAQQHTHSRISRMGFIARVSERSGWPPAAVEPIYEAILQEIFESVTIGKHVVLENFGTFFAKVHKGHKVQFGKPEIGPYLMMRFRGAKALKEQLNGDPEYLETVARIEGVDLAASEPAPVAEDEVKDPADSTPVEAPKELVLT